MAEVSGSLEMNSRRAYHHEFCDSFLTIIVTKFRIEQSKTIL